MPISYNDELIIIKYKYKYSISISINKKNYNRLVVGSRRLKCIEEGHTYYLVKYNLYLD